MHYQFFWKGFEELNIADMILLVLQQFQIRNFT